MMCVSIFRQPEKSVSGSQVDSNGLILAKKPALRTNLILAIGHLAQMLVLA
ncbi:hypothetical protein [Alysiella filiformis]|uniref:hypothetical protein n=1 Tax=Alysiella filiformis TaxID=194196 RepID=UPI0015F64980|nr:hypothetical protein [Alysiella filiformis]QMT31222.1 hypothetical protein H3L97_11035 [Alysiella filiformis]UBQ55778.1 hypothetical protein JF568_09430 [Alysiella filiformis DSM 16848]